MLERLIQPFLKESLIDGKLSLKLAGAECSGALDGDKINGTWNRNDQTIPLVLIRE